MVFYLLIRVGWMTHLFLQFPVSTSRSENCLQTLNLCSFQIGLCYSCRVTEGLTAVWTDTSSIASARLEHEAAERKMQQHR